MGKFPILMRLISFLAFATAGLASAAEPSAQAQQAALAGRYDGGQMEMAVALELGADGRFRYALSYGALDEQAEGTWTAADGEVQLTSDPLVLPRFVVVPGKSWSLPNLSILLDVPPGISRQYFTAHVAMADGGTIERQLGADGLTLKLGRKDRALAVTLELEIYGVRSAPLILARGRGGEAHFRFEPGDLGKVAFDRTPLLREGGVLLFERHGRTIRFRRRP
jgi:hypothetical protein